MILIVGLGNPGPKYALNRHNIGFLAIDTLIGVYDAGPERDKFDSILSETVFQGHKIVFLKPQTYMNESGLAVHKALQFYKLTPQDVIVIHDEIDLAPGEVKTKTGGGAAGHNGLKSLDAHIGKEYHRIRLGVGHPGHKDDVSDYVLSNFGKAEQKWVEDVLADLPNTVEKLIAEKGLS